MFIAGLPAAWRLSFQVPADLASTPLSFLQYLGMRFADTFEEYIQIS